MRQYADMGAKAHKDSEKAPDLQPVSVRPSGADSEDLESAE